MAVSTAPTTRTSNTNHLRPRERPKGLLGREVRAVVMMDVLVGLELAGRYGTP